MGTTVMQKLAANRFTIAVVLLEIMFILIYAFCIEYESALSHGGIGADGGMDSYYPLYQDVHVMIFIGFGFLMTFVSRYAWSAVGFNFLLSALAIQWALLTDAFFHAAQLNKWDKASVNIVSLINADFAAASLMITFGAVLGKTSALQMVVIMFFEIIIYSANATVVFINLKAIDMGGSMVIHMFGAYFGLAVSWMLGNPAHPKGAQAPVATATYTKWSSTGSMIGTIFLWCFWPSFNGALALGAQQHRVVINTVLSISASCAATFMASRLLRPGNKFDFEDIANATLAGGVAVGSSADLVIQPWGAILIGCVAGVLATVGFAKLSAVLDKKFKIHDTCGVHNLHGMSGILGGICGGVSAALAGSDSYGINIGLLFPARAPSDPAAAAAIGAKPGLDRSAAAQGNYQIAAIMVTLAIAITGGLIVGFIVKLPIFAPMTEHFYDDESDWITHHVTDQSSASQAHGENDALIGHAETAAAPTSASEVELVRKHEGAGGSASAAADKPVEAPGEV